MFCLGDSNSPERTYANNICLNISDPTRNGEYEPYWTSTLEIPAATYFPDGMRSAGSVYDELTKDSAVTRIGAVDLGTLEWSWQSTWKTWFTGYYTNLKGTDISSVKANIICDNYPTLTQSTMQDGVLDEVGIGAVGSPSNGWRFCAKTASDTVKPSGIAYYEFITPTTTPIDPPLNLAYKVERGGTEQIIVPTGEMSAPPTMAIVYALDADGMRDESLSVIAAIENGKASTNYAVGSYLIHDGKLYKVTSAIASGESITPGTNCTQTTVMAELLALTA